MVDEQRYMGLKPGQYIQIGNTIKAVTSFEQWLGAGSTRTPSAETLAARVAWVFVALAKRRAQIDQTPISWHRGESELEEDQLTFSPVMEMPRIDKALQLHGVAYLHKRRNQSGRFLGLRWLDPAVIEPDDMTVDNSGYTRYFRDVDGRRIIIPAEDMLRVFLPGLRELSPDTTAAGATSLDAQIAYGMSQTLDGFFDTGGLPVLFIDVPGNALDEMVARLKSRWQRILKREGDGVNKVIVTTGGATVTTLSLAPEQLDTTNISESKADAILAAHGVPAALVHRDVNRAEAELKAEMFAADMLARLRLVMMQINGDPDVEATGYRLMAHPERMEITQRAELSKAETLQRLTGRPVMSLNEARERLELEPVADGDDIAEAFGGGRLGTGQLPAQTAPTPETDTKSSHKERERQSLIRYIKKGGHYRRPFTSDVLTRYEIAQTIAEYDPIYVDIATTYP